MNSKKIIWSNNARCALKKLDKPIVKRIIDRVERLQLEGFIPSPLVGKFKGLYKLYAGDWRVLYAFEDDSIVIHDVGHRSDIYK
ncbi:MAG: type II toxin-antitoxin system mRNA interferase toxin, RelE/StbE family [Nitrospirae bacterium]|nr:type II toxin-antitoxin system mRNA interferase toxin, RelE/StbE family [Nitrospirota bacterium]